MLVISAFGNVLFYEILKRTASINYSYVYIKLLEISIQTSFDFLNQIPAITISVLIALMTIFFTIITLSFNLNSKFPDKIIYKYIIYNKRVTTYLSVLAGFLLTQVSILLLNLYNNYWSLVFLFDIIVVIFWTISFFYWFIKITNKKGIFAILEDNVESKHLKNNSKPPIFDKLPDFDSAVSGDYHTIKSKIFDSKKIPAKPPQIMTNHSNPFTLAYDEKEGMQHFSFSPTTGIAKVDYKKLNKLLKENSEIISYGILISDGAFVSRLNLLNKICFYTEDEIKLKELIRAFSEITQVIEPEEIEEINDWLLFLDHSRRINPKEIEDDFDFLKEVLKKAIACNQLHIIRLIFDTLERNFDINRENNDKILEQTISLIYKLKSMLSNNFNMLQFIQSKFKSIIINYSHTLSNKYSPRYATAILYLSEFIRFDFMTSFENEGNIKNLEKYNFVLTDNIECGNQILTNTINLHFEDTRIYEKYLKEHMQQFISILQFYYDDPYHYDYNHEYHSLKTDVKKLIDTKTAIIKTLKKTQRIKITDAALHLLYLIENETVSSKLINLVFDFMKFGNIYEYGLSADPSPWWVMDEKLHSDGAFMVPKFPSEKYITYYLIYAEFNNYKIEPTELKYHQVHFIEELNKTIEATTYADITKWIDIPEEKFNEIKQKLGKSFLEGIEKCNNDEKNIVINSDIDKDLVNEFEKKLITYWDERSIIRRLFKSAGNYEQKLNKKPSTTANKSFGFYFIFEKSYFMKNPPVPWARTVESDYGINLAKSENETILREIISKKRLRTTKDTLEISLNKCITKLANKDSLVIILGSHQRENLLKTASFVHKYQMAYSPKDPKQWFYEGIYKFMKLKIPVYIFDVDATLVIDLKNIAKLVQYSPYGNSTKEIYVEVSALEENDTKNLDKLESPKSKVKVRILEQFRIEKINKNAFCGYSLKNNTPQKL